MGLGSGIQGSKRHRIPDPDPQHCRDPESQNPVPLTLGSWIRIQYEQPGSYPDSGSVPVTDKLVLVEA
jgi:hypothetical protein